MEGLDQLDPREDLQQALHHLGDLLLASAAGAADARTEDLQHHADGRTHEQGHEREPPVQVQRRPHGREDLEGVLHRLAKDQGLGAVRDQRIVARAGDEAASRVGLKVAQRHSQELAADVELQVDSHAGHHPLARVVADQPHDRHAQHYRQPGQQNGPEALAHARLHGFPLAVQLLLKLGVELRALRRVAQLCKGIGGDLWRQHVVQERLDQVGAAGQSPRVEQ